jgi:hypothetical protein
MSAAVDEAAEDTLNSLERLILAQAVYELGSDAWTNVSSILSRHPLILQCKRDNAIFSPSVPALLSVLSYYSLHVHCTGLPKHLP